jgi:hypothetical protein
MAPLAPDGYRRPAPALRALADGPVLTHAVLGHIDRHHRRNAVPPLEDAPRGDPGGQTNIE